MNRNGLTLRSRTDVHQKNAGHMDSFKAKYMSIIIKTFSINGLLQDMKARYCVNMDQAAIYFPFGVNRVIYFIEANIVTV